MKVARSEYHNQITRLCDVGWGLVDWGMTGHGGHTLECTCGSAQAVDAAAKGRLGRQPDLIF